MTDRLGGGRFGARCERHLGLAWAREWRERHRAEFDALFGVERCCPECHSPRRASQ